MSKELLRSLNGNMKGRFHQWLEKFEGESRIAWYPSAGKDLRDVLYLSSAYDELSKGKDVGHFSGIDGRNKVEPPNIFIHTDYLGPWLRGSVVYTDEETRITIAHSERLPDLCLPLSPELVAFPKRKYTTDRVLFLELNVESRLFGSYTVPLIYAVVENSAFCVEKALAMNANFSHIMHIRYGGGCGGGGHSKGDWLENVLKPLNCEMYIADYSKSCDYLKYYDKWSGLYDIKEFRNELPLAEKRIISDRVQDPASKKYPSLLDNKEDLNLEIVSILESKLWSGSGDVTWNVVK